MNTGSIVAIVLIIALVIGGVFLATRPPAAPLPMLQAGGTPTAEGAQYIQAAGGLISSVIGSIGSLYNIGDAAGGSSEKE